MSNIFFLQCGLNIHNEKQNISYFFSSTRWLRPIVHIDLYKDEVKKIWNPLKKNFDKNDDFVYSIP